MKFVRAVVQWLIAMSAVSLADEADHEHVEVTMSFLMERLPFSVSDNSVATNSDGSLIYLSGGCDAVNGNEYVDAGDYPGYYCSSVTSALVQFDPMKEKFTQLMSAPRARYRHASVMYNDRYLILIGGRTLEDSLITEVDVYDSLEQKWLQAGMLPDVPSDMGSFISDDGYVYVVGGYDAFYTALSSMVMIKASDILASVNQNSNITTTDAPSMLVPRGDVHAAIQKIDDGNMRAFVSGGFSHENDFAAPLDDVEVFDLSSSEWYEIDGLIQGRGDKALQIHGKHLFAIGGEGKDSESNSIAHDDIETLEVGFTSVDDVKEQKWHRVGDIPSERFRFVSAVHPSKNVIYTFGGQRDLDESCNCYPTSDLVSSYEYTIEEDSDNNVDPVIIAVVISCFVAFMFFVIWTQRKLFVRACKRSMK